jgi:hypothetical protein
VATQAKFEIGMWRDTTDARDVAIMTPHFKVVSASPDWDALASDLATAINTWVGNSGVQIRIRVYDDEGSPPRRPLAEAIRNPGNSTPSASNRDTAVCLSFHGGSGRPTERGRLYVPLYILGIAGTGANVSTATQTKVGALAPILANLGGVNVDWVVWSAKLHSSKPVTNWHVDNAFDTQRRRGLTATARLSGTVDEDDVPNLRLLVPQPDQDLLQAVEQSRGNQVS